MRHTARILCALLLAGVCTCQASAVGTSAASAVLIEQSSGRTLYEDNAREERLIASITKIMTCVVALEEGDLQQSCTVTDADMAEGSSMYLKPGETLRLEELLYGLMLQSGNDAALTVARCVSGSVEAFVSAMNEKAEALGMDHTHFSNPNGLDAEDHYSCAADMAVLAAYALRNRDFERIVSTSSITIGDRYLKNHNRLLTGYEGCVGVKTGYTKAAGRTLVSAARRSGMTLVCVTLNDRNDWDDHMALLDYGFGTCRMTTAAESGQILAAVSVTGGTADTVPLMAAKDLSCPVREGEVLTAAIRLPLHVSAPVTPGQTVGTMALLLNGEELASVDLIAAGASARKLDTDAGTVLAY